LAETDLRAADDNAALFEAVLTHLIDRRLLTVDNHDAGPARKVDIAHEALITGWKRLDDWVKDRRTAEQARRQLEAKTEEWVRLGSGEGGLLDRVQLKEADAYLTSPAGKLLGVSTKTAAFIAASRKAADPGWNTWGTVGLAVAAFALVALLGAALFATQTILLSVAARVALLAFWALILVGAVGVLWALRRSEPHFLKHWSHNVVTRPLWSGAFGLTVAAACVVWIYIGGWMLPLEQECAEQGFGRGGIASQIAVISEDIDPYYATVFARLLKRVSNESAEGLHVSREQAQRCRLFLEHAVALGAAESSDRSNYVYADKIDLRTGDRTQLATGVSTSGDCRDIAYLAADVVQEFGLGMAMNDETLFAAGGLSCQAVLVNEKGIEAGKKQDYATAERYYREALAIEPNFVDAKVNLGWAFYNTGRAQHGVDQLREAQMLLPMASLTIEYHLGRACFRAGDMICAEAALMQALDLTEDTEQRLWRLQDLFQVYQQTGDFEHADLILQRLSDTLYELTPDRKHHDILLPFDQGVLAYERGQWNEAMDYLKTADDYQNFDILDWAKIALIAVLDRDRSDEVWRTYRTWDEEITYLLAKTAEKLGEWDASCRYLERYASTPSASLFGEAERRAEAQKMTVTLGCEIR
jgi:tetratricopeptide (TPR) repeat protein